MKISDQIESAEKEFIQKLEEFFISVFDNNKLPSHGLDHHRRVWKYVKEILTLTELTLESPGQNFVPGLIISSYLHDIGMSVDPGEKHGKISRELTVDFLKSINIRPETFVQALYAIENHDKKDYSSNSASDNFFKILSVADDLDAFGIIGVYRYLEIYLLRGNDPEKIGMQIQLNCSGRYQNMISCFGMYPDFADRHSLRYMTLNEFCNRYNEQSPGYPFGSANPYGYCGVADIISGVVNRKLTFEDLLTQASQNSYEKHINEFFKRLKNELHTGSF
jgi:hypothetical protein